jgi:hypothetical protein
MLVSLNQQQIDVLRTIAGTPENNTPHDYQKEVYAWRRAFPNFGWCADGSIRRLDFAAENFEQTLIQE